MAKFNFSLQRVLDYKLQLEEEAKIRLGQAQRELSAKIQEIQDIKKGLEYISVLMGQGNPSSPELISLFIDTEKNLLADLARCERELETITYRVTELKKDLISKTIERKKIEKLREQQKKRYEYEERKKEQKEIDEISTIRYQGLFK